MGGRSRAARLSLGVLVALALPGTVLATTLNVNSTADTLVAGDGQCTLREAIINANGDSDNTAGDCAAGSGPDTILLPAGHYTLHDGLSVTAPLRLLGLSAGSTVLQLDSWAYSGAPLISLDEVDATLRIERVTLAGTLDGVLDGGGGLHNVAGADLALVDSEVSGGFGTALFVNGGTTTISRSSIHDNIGAGFSCVGAILVDGGSVRVEDSTISANRCIDAHVLAPAGAIFVADGSLSLAFSTVTDNTCFVTSCRAIHRGATAEIRIKASVLSNPPGNCDAPALSDGYSLDGDGTCGLTDPTDLSNIDPLLGPLQNNGGPTPTHALLRGSPAIDRIPTSDCTYDDDGTPQTPEIPLTKDQRGGMRPREGNGGAPSGCDIGAYEVAACADGIDNDGDGLIDFDGGATAGITPLGSHDPNCSNALGNMETAPTASGCGLGPELALLIPALWAMRHRRRES